MPIDQERLSTVLYRLSGRDRWSALIACYDHNFDERLLVGHGMLEQGVVIEAYGAIGRLDAAEALAERCLSSIYHPVEDAKYHVSIHTGLVRAAARLCRFEPDRAAAIATRARAYLDRHLPEPIALKKENERFQDLRLLIDLLEGLVLEARGHYADGAILLRDALDHRPHWAGDIKPRIEAAYARCLARLDPCAAFTRRMWAEMQEYDEPWSFNPHWLMGLIDRDPAAASAVLDKAPPRDRDLTATWRRAARKSMKMWQADKRARDMVMRMIDKAGQEEYELYPRLATWRYEMQRRLGDRRVADAHLEPLRDLEPETGWPFVRRLCIYDSRTDPHLGPVSPVGVRQVLGAAERLRNDDDGSVRVVAGALVARCRLLLGEPLPALSVIRQTMRHMRKSRHGPLRWLAPPAWPDRDLALKTYRDILRVVPGHARERTAWCRRVEPRVAAAMSRQYLTWAQEWPPA